MKLFPIFILISVLTMLINAQNDRVLIADGTVDFPKRYDLQPTVESLKKEEFEAVKKAALETEVEFKTTPQMSAEESNFKKDFELLDVAEGFFIYREFEFRAYLYSAYSQKMKRNYQGIIVFRISNNDTKFSPQAHYVYAYRGDKHLRQMSDINGNFLSELAIYSMPPAKKGIRHIVRIIEFSPNGLRKIGRKEIRLSKASGGTSVSAVKLFYEINLGKPVIFYAQSWQNLPKKGKDFWVTSERQTQPTTLDEDNVNYLELLKPVFPKGPGEK